MVDDLSREKDRQSQADLDLRQVIHQVRGQSVRTPSSVIIVCVESRSPMEQQLEFLQPTDKLILLDERGKNLHSPELAKLLQQHADQSTKNLIFLIGGAYGVSDAVKKRADFCWSLSNLVFPHMLVRLILAEQLYRACTIMRNEKYHHA